MIIDLKASPVLFKRYRATVKLHDGTLKYIDFGLKTGNTYTDKRTVLERDNYRKRHLANKAEHNLITNLIISPSLLSYYLLWGDSKKIQTNINTLNKLLK